MIWMIKKIYIYVISMILLNGLVGSISYMCFRKIRQRLEKKGLISMCITVLRGAVLSFLMPIVIVFHLLCIWRRLYNVCTVSVGRMGIFCCRNHLDDCFFKSYTENNTYSGTNESITKEGMCMQQIYFRLQESMELKKVRKLNWPFFSSKEIKRDDKDFVAGIIDETGKERYVMHAVDIIHDFYVKKDGKYKVFVENRYKKKIKIGRASCRERV